MSTMYGQHHPPYCQSCNGCNVDGCEAQCHGREFGVHSDPPATSDPELTRLLAEEEAIERQIAEQAEVMKAKVRLPESKYETTVESLVRDYRRGWDTVKSQQARLDALTLENARLKVQVLKDQLWHAEEALAWIEDPYRYG